MKPYEARSVRELVVALQSAEADYEFFWGHTPAHVSRVDRSCLSNWFPAPFALAGLKYPTTEHYMMAEKARLFSDFETLELIRQAKTPGDAKKLGRLVRGFHDASWVAHRFEIVVRGNEAKFQQHAPLRDYLLGTGTSVLVEASPTDTIWGIGLSRDRAEQMSPREWNGLNLLGFALMEVRKTIQPNHAVHPTPYGAGDGWGSVKI